MKQLIGIEYQDPAEADITIVKDGLRVNLENRCVFVVSKAKKMSVRDTRKEEEKS